MFSRVKKKTILGVKPNVISQEDAISKLFGIDRLLFRKDFEDILKQSLHKEKECPIKMGGSGALELIYYACEFTQAKNAIETGVAYGWSTLASILSLKKRNGTLYSSDMPYLGQDGDQYVGCIVPENLKKYWRLFRFADKESLPKIFAENKILMLYIMIQTKAIREDFGLTENFISI